MTEGECPGGHINGATIVTDDRIVVPLYVDELAATTAEPNGPTDPAFWPMDGTFNTNRAGLVLMAVGPGGSGGPANGVEASLGDVAWIQNRL